MEFQTLSQEHALCIADTWHYGGIYEFYDMTADPEDYAEFVDEIQRSKNDHYESLQDGALVGFFSVERQGTTVELGLGLGPAAGPLRKRPGSNFCPGDHRVFGGALHL